MSDKKSSQTSQAPATEPKQLPAIEAAPQDLRPDYIKNCPELPAGACVFVLTPSDEIERRAVQEQLDKALYQYFEVQPTEAHQLKAARLPYGSILFVAHCTTERARRDDGTFGPVRKIHIGGPIELKNFTSRSADGYTWETDLGRVVDAVTAAAKHQNGIVWLGGLSGDTVKDQKVVKLIKS